MNTKNEKSSSMGDKRSSGKQGSDSTKSTGKSGNKDGRSTTKK
jgi:hypothetical protein